ELRKAMRIPEDAFDDDRLLDSFRAAHARRATRRRRWRLGVGAAGIAASIALALVATLDRNEDATIRAASTQAPAPPVDASAAPATPAWAVFHPLPFSPGVSTGTSYSVVRVRIPASSFPAAYTAEPYASVEADLLLGPDGIPAAIRFVDSDEVFVTAAANSKERCHGARMAKHHPNRRPPPAARGPRCPRSGRRSRRNRRECRIGQTVGSFAGHVAGGERVRARPLRRSARRRRAGDG